MRATCQRPGVAAARYGYSAEQWLVVCVIDRALSDLLGLDGGEYNDDKPDGYWRVDAAAYFVSPLYVYHCDCIGVDASAFLKHSGALEQIRNMVK